MEKFFKTPDQISALMEHWFLSYHGKDRDFFTGSETLTFFDLIHETLQWALLQRARLDDCEKPVFLLNCGNAVFVLNTTHRFMWISKSDLESVFYTDFNGHSGFNSIMVQGAKKSIKTDGYFADFGLITQSRAIVYWSIPSGSPGFAFWNITKNVSL